GAGHERGVGLELRRVALALAVEEAFEVGALVAARLVVDDPEPAPVAEDAVHDEGARARGRARAEPKLRPRLRMRAEDPAAALVGNRLRERLRHELGGALELARRHAAALELGAEARLQPIEARGVPAAKLVVGDALEPAVDDGADVARGLAHPGELDVVFAP